jgi:hypothetical protein
MTEDQLIDAAERAIDIYRDEITRLHTELAALREQVKPIVAPIDITDQILTAVLEGKRILLQLGTGAAPQPAPEVIRAAFHGFLASQGYDEQDRFDQDEMELAFETGMFVQAAAPAAPQPAPDTDAVGPWETIAARPKNAGGQ